MMVNMRGPQNDVSIDTFPKAAARARLRAAQLRCLGFDECAQEIEIAVCLWASVLAALN